MSGVVLNYENLKAQIPANVVLVAVSKFKSYDIIQEVYNAGQRVFGENYVQELVDKYEALPKDIDWHFIGHLQSNKVKYIAPFVSLIHSVDSYKLLHEINKQAKNNNRIINCLLQISIAQETTKSGLETDELNEILDKLSDGGLENVKIVGFMGMSTFTEDQEIVKSEFQQLKKEFEMTLNKSIEIANVTLEVISMGMSGDWQLAVKEGSNMVRIGSTIFGSRKN